MGNQVCCAANAEYEHFEQPHVNYRRGKNIKEENIDNIGNYNKRRNHSKGRNKSANNRDRSRSPIDLNEARKKCLLMDK